VLSSVSALAVAVTVAPTRAANERDSGADLGSRRAALDPIAPPDSPAEFATRLAVKRESARAFAEA
jgi:hypothetical protein